MSLESRFWEKVEISDPDGCWLWTAATNGVGYGRFWNGVRLDYAHRVAYELLREPKGIPAPLELDHLCRVTLCVNPWHLEPVTRRVNFLRGIGPLAEKARQTHCKRGHALAGDNLYVEPRTGKRKCQTCQRAEHRARREVAA